MTIQNTLLQAALQYAKLGFPVFPCSGKIPLTPQGVKDATTNAEVIESLWAKHPTANIGMATGKTSGLIVLDVDVADGKQGEANLYQLFTELSSNPYQYPSVITPSLGLHIYFKFQEGVRNKIEFRPGLDIRSEGGYVIVPPSGEYRWAKPITPESLSYLPPQLFDEIKTDLSEVNLEIFQDNESISKGGRHKHLMALAGSLRKRDLSLEAIRAAIAAENDAKCSPPIPESDINRMVQSVSRYAPGTSVSTIMADSGHFDVQQASVEKVSEAPKPSSLTDQETSSGQLIRAKDLTGNTLSYLKDKDKVRGQPRGFDGLDKMLGGGARLGEVTCWHAEAKTGKNTLWHYLMFIWLELGIPIAYASRELSPEEEVLPNLLSVATARSALKEDVTEDNTNEYNKIINNWPLYFSHGYGYFPVKHISEWVDKAIQAGINHFFFDHLHYMLEDPEDHKAASKLIKDLKSLAKTKKIHIDIIIQPNKLSDGQRLSLNSIKGGAAMGQAIDNLLILERVKNSPNVCKLTLEVARSKLCDPGSIYLQYDKETTRFVETQPEPVTTREPQGNDSGAEQPAFDRAMSIRNNFPRVDLKTLI